MNLGVDSFLYEEWSNIYLNCFFIYIPYLFFIAICSLFLLCNVCVQYSFNTFCIKMHVVLVNPLKSFNEFCRFKFCYISVCNHESGEKLHVIQSIPRYKNRSTGGSINQAFAIALWTDSGIKSDRQKHIISMHYVNKFKCHLPNLYDFSMFTT